MDFLTLDVTGTVPNPAGNTSITAALDVDLVGSRLLAIGNFRTVDGLERSRGSSC